MTVLLRTVLRLLLGGLFVFAGALKIFDPASFASDIANFHLLPANLVNLVAITLPWIEVSAGLLLLLGTWVRASAFVVLALLVVFLAAITVALARGLNIDCGCFGTIAGQKIGGRKLAEDAVLLFIAAWLVWRTTD